MKNKALNIIIDIIVAIVLIAVVTVTICIIASAGKGYTDFFGYTYVAVKSDSMEGDGELNFSKGDLLFIKILDDGEKSELKKGDVVAFLDDTIIAGQYELNTHRINDDPIVTQEHTYYTTKGDNADYADGGYRTEKAIIGLYQGNKIGGIGTFLLWMSRSIGGFIVCIVIPSLLIIGYFTYNLIVVVKQRNGVTDVQKKEALRAEILAELESQGKLAATTTKDLKDTDDNIKK